MLLVFSHQLTEEQKHDAIYNLNINEFISMPKDLQNLWMNIPPTLTSLEKYLKPICNWIKEVSKESDYILIHGDFGAVYLMVNYAFSKGLIPIYATTERKVVEKRLPDGSIKFERVFKHKIFRKYEKGGKV